MGRVFVRAKEAPALRERLEKFLGHAVTLTVDDVDDKVVVALRRPPPEAEPLLELELIDAAEGGRLQIQRLARRGLVVTLAERPLVYLVSEPTVLDELDPSFDGGILLAARGQTRFPRLPANLSLRALRVDEPERLDDWSGIAALRSLCWLSVGSVTTSDLLEAITSLEPLTSLSVHLPSGATLDALARHPRLAWLRVVTSRSRTPNPSFEEAAAIETRLVSRAREIVRRVDGAQAAAFDGDAERTQRERTEAGPWEDNTWWTSYEERRGALCLRFSAVESAGTNWATSSSKTSEVTLRIEGLADAMRFTLSDYASGTWGNDGSVSLAGTSRIELSGPRRAVLAGIEAFRELAEC